jgi:hypothetical protein
MGQWLQEGRFMTLWRRLCLAIGIVLLGACADDGPKPLVPLTLVNDGSRRMIFEVVKGSSGGDMDARERAVRVVLDPGKKAKYKLPAGKYTLFPREWMFQGTYGLAFETFKLKADQPLVISLDSRKRAIFTGDATYMGISAKATSEPSPPPKSPQPSRSPKKR